MTDNNRYGLEKRTLQFAMQTRAFIKKVPRTITSIEDLKQLTRSSGSVGANFIEAVDALSKKDSIYRMKISRKEAKESKYWLTLLDLNDDLLEERKFLIQESYELMNIFGSIIRKKEALI